MITGSFLKEIVPKECNNLGMVLPSWEAGDKNGTFLTCGLLIFLAFLEMCIIVTYGLSTIFHPAAQFKLLVDLHGASASNQLPSKFQPQCRIGWTIHKANILAQQHWWINSACTPASISCQQYTAFLLLSLCFYSPFLRTINPNHSPNLEQPPMSILPTHDNPGKQRRTSGSKRKSHEPSQTTFLSTPPP